MQVGQIARDSHANGDGDLAALLEGIGTGEDGDPAAAGQKLVQDDTVIVTAGTSVCTVCTMVGSVEPEPEVMRVSDAIKG